LSKKLDDTFANHTTCCLPADEIAFINPPNLIWFSDESGGGFDQAITIALFGPK